MQRYLFSSLLFIVSAALSSMQFLPVSFLPGAFFGVALGLAAYKGLQNGLPQVLALGAMGYILLLGCYYLNRLIGQNTWYLFETPLPYLLLTFVPGGLAAMLIYRSMAWQLGGKATIAGLVLTFLVGYICTFAEVMDDTLLNILPTIFNNHPTLNLVWQLVVGNLILVLYKNTLSTAS